MKAPVIEPRLFGPDGRKLAGWLHHAAAGRCRDLGLVICNPFGYEALSAHRSLRHFADAAAREGVAALRFDYHGTGDSSGDDRDPGRWRAWTDSVHHAADDLRAATGVERICLLGVRLGATIAASAAAEREYQGLAAIAPVIAGKAWLREMKALEMAMGLAGPPPGHELDPEEQEAIGHVITAESRRDISAVNLATVERAPAPDVLLIDRDDMPAGTAWAERLAALGARVDHRRLPGYTAMMLDPHDAMVPAEMVAAHTAWLVQRCTATTGRTGTEPPASVTAIMAPGVEETAGFLDAERTVFGIVSAPASKPRPSRAIVLLNAGAINHAGVGRYYVELARRWAARDYVVLRFDIAGIGESRPWPGEKEHVVYSGAAVRDIELAIGFLRDQWGIGDVQALGLCSGAYHGFKAAVAGLPLRSVTAINPLVFFWRPGMSLAFPDYKVSEAVASYKQSVLRLDKWKKLFSGKVDLRGVTDIVSRRVAQQAGTLVRDMARAAGRPFDNDLGVELEAIDRRGIALHFVFATGDPGEDLLRTQSGSALGRLVRRGRVGLRRIEGPNHTFTAVWSRVVLTRVLEEQLGIR